MGIEFDGHVFEEYFVESLNYVAKPVKDAYKLLDYLAGKYTICLTSNAPYGQQINRLKIADMHKYARKIYISEKIGHSKPNKEFFDHCINDLGVIDLEDIILIGDSYSADVKGAINSNLDVIWLD